jgi:hypothetical protein
MNKSIELPQLTIKALQDGASIMIVPCKVECMALKGDIPCALTLEQKAIPLIEFAPLQVGDKDVFVKEEFDQKEMMPYPAYKVDFEPTGTILDDIPWRPASQMTKEQSRFSIDVRVVRVVRVQDIGLSCMAECMYDTTLHHKPIGCLTKDFFVNRFNNTETGKRISLGRYEDNPYVFLYDVKVTTKEFHKGTEDK